MSFRAATAADFEALAALVSEFYAEEGYAFDLEASRRALARLLGDPSLGRAWIADDDAGPSAYAIVAFGYSLEYGGRDAFVDELFVRPRARGRGLGKEAVAVAESGCRQAGVRVLHLEVELENARALEIYRRAGFVDHQRRLLSKRLAGPPAADALRLPERMDTARLALRRPRLADADSIHRYASDAETTRSMIWPTHRSRSDTLAFLHGCAARWDSGEEHAWAITEGGSDQAIGTIGVRVRDHAAELGWIVARPYWNRGLMTEAAGRLVEVLSSLPRIRRIWAITNVDNGASARVMEKIGMSREGVLRRHAIYPNLSAEPQDSFVYAKIVR